VTESEVRGDADYGYVRLLGAPWEGLRQRPQQLMIQLARYHKVLYVDPPRRVPRLLPLRRVGGNLWALHPWAPSALLGRPRSRAGNHVLAYIVRLGMKLVGIESPVVWHSEYESWPFIGRLGERLNLYDCCDDFVSLAADPERAAQEEGEMLGRADGTIVTSESLLEQKRSRARRILLAPNAADAETFRPSPHLSRPHDLDGVVRPIIGFVGAFNDWVDTELVGELARSRRDWSFVVVGPIGAEVTGLRHHENVYFLGRKDYENLPAYYAHIDVGIVPFRVSDFTKCIDPIKVYEFLAMGKPVVATDLPEMRKFGDLILTARFAREFEERIEEALRTSETVQARRIAWGLENSWSHRAAQIERFIVGAMEG